VNETIDVRETPWVVPEMWPAPDFVQVGERQCPAWGLGSQCQGPLGHAGMHHHQGRMPNGEYMTGAWGDMSLLGD